MQVLEGDILLTRNAGGEARNTSPGYYNHSAIIGPLNWVIEAQGDPGFTVCVPIWYFFERYPEILVLRHKDSYIAKKTGNDARLFVGKGYSSYMSVRPLFLWKSTDNCVSLIKRIYNYSTGTTPNWIVPDHLKHTKWLQKIALHKDYENYKPPKSYKLGMQIVWSGKPAQHYYIPENN